MSNNIEQNGRQLATEQAAPPTDPRTRGLRAVPPTPESQRICRDFVWGICSMNEHCKYRHELDYESMRSILKFCHDYQNRTGCLRSECTYLHASREEENLFLTNGVIPRALAERYASMTTPGESTPESLPQMMYMSEYISQPPPPPPPPPPNAQTAQSAPASLPAPMAGPASIAGPASMGGPATIGSQMMPHMTGSLHTAMTQMPVANMMPAPLPSARQLEQPSHSQMQQPSHSQMQQPSHSQMQQPSHSQMQQPSHSQMQLTVKTNMHAVMPSMAAPVAAPMPAMLAPPPPPPPPPTLTTAPTQMAAPVFTVAQPLQHSVPAMYPITPCPQPQQPLQPTPQFVMFDPSRPPPPIPVKRAAPSEPEAGPSKVLKLDESIDSLCETCVEQNLRTALDQQEIEKLQREEEYRRRIYEQKTEEYENGNMLMRSLLSPQMFRVVNEFLDINSQPSDIFGASSSPTYSNNSSETTVPKQFMFQLMEFLLNKRNANQHSSPLDILTRRSTSQTELMFASLLELLQNGITSDNRISPLAGIGGNGLGRLTNGTLDLVPPAARYPPPGPRYPASAPAYVPTNQVEVVPPTAPYQPEPVPQPMYVPYQAAPAPASAPPPQRPYYHPYAASSSNMISASYASTSSAPPPAQVPAPAPAPAPATQPPPAQHYQYLARMPHHYYPPFQ